MKHNGATKRHIPRYGITPLGGYTTADGSRPALADFSRFSNFPVHSFGQNAVKYNAGLSFGASRLSTMLHGTRRGVELDAALAIDQRRSSHART